MRFQNKSLKKYRKRQSVRKGRKRQSTRKGRKRQSTRKDRKRQSARKGRKRTRGGANETTGFCTLDTEPLSVSGYDKTVITKQKNERENIRNDLSDDEKKELDKTLFDAVNDGNKGVVCQKLGEGANPDGDEENRPLHAATILDFENGIQIVNNLIRAGADINARDDDEDTPLIVAAGMGFVSAVESLLNAGADKTLTNNNGKNALEQAKHYKEEYEQKGENNPIISKLDTIISLLEKEE